MLNGIFLKVSKRQLRYHMMMGKSSTLLPVLQLYAVVETIKMHVESLPMIHARLSELGLLRLNHRFGYVLMYEKCLCDVNDIH